MRLWAKHLPRVAKLVRNPGKFRPVNSCEEAFCNAAMRWRVPIPHHSAS